MLRLSGLCHPLQALPLHSGGTQADAADALDFAEWAVDNAQLACWTPSTPAQTPTTSELSNRIAAVTTWSNCAGVQTGERRSISYTFEAELSRRAAETATFSTPCVHFEREVSVHECQGTRAWSR